MDGDLSAANVLLADAPMEGSGMRTGAAGQTRCLAKPFAIRLARGLVCPELLGVTRFTPTALAGG